MSKNRHTTVDTERCTRCADPIEEGQKVCACGAATRFLTFEERAAYEVELWRKSRPSTATA